MQLIIRVHVLYIELAHETMVYMKNIFAFEHSPQSLLGLLAYKKLEVDKDSD